MVNSENLSFLDGYLFRVMVDMLRASGPQESGFYEYYRSRVEQVGTALSDYGRFLADYLAANFDPTERRVVHAGIGLGTLASALAVRGFNVTGLEYDGKRFDAAIRVRSALADKW